MVDLMTREEHIRRQDALRSPADASRPTEELEAELQKLTSEINALYWVYSRSTSARSGPPNCPEKYGRRRAVRAELMHRTRRP